MLNNDKLNDKTYLKKYPIYYINEKYKHIKFKNFLRKFFFVILIILIFLVIFFFIEYKSYKNIPHTALINIDGPIMSNENCNLNNVTSSINKILNNKNSKGLILKINSPGGSPVQSDMIYNYLKNVKSINFNIKIYSFIEDICASGAYLIANSSDLIYCNSSSIVGSIGVLLNSFGFVDFINKIGIERRLYLSGESKGMLDPFSLKNDKENDFLMSSLNVIHNEFIDTVKLNRNNRLNYFNYLFNGRFWIGREALFIGLVDGFYNIEEISSEVIGFPIIVNYTKNFNSVFKLGKNFFNFFIN